MKKKKTPTIKNYLYSQYYLDSIFSEWILTTIGNNISRNIVSKRDNYFHKKNENNQASKSVSELVDNNLKKSNYRMLLSRSNFKKKKTNIIAKKIKSTMKNKTSKENDFHNKKILRSLKIINNSDSLRHKSLINKKNNINIIKHNESPLRDRRHPQRPGVLRDLFLAGPLHRRLHPRHAAAVSDRLTNRSERVFGRDPYEKNACLGRPH